MRVSGIRGIGKTVMLNALGEVAQSKGFYVANVASDAGFCDRIVQMVALAASFQAVTVEPELWGLKAGSIEFAKTAPTFGEILLRSTRCKTPPMKSCALWATRSSSSLGVGPTLPSPSRGCRFPLTAL